MEWEVLPFEDSREVTNCTTLELKQSETRVTSVEGIMHPPELQSEGYRIVEPRTHPRLPESSDSFSL